MIDRTFRRTQLRGWNVYEWQPGDGITCQWAKRAPKEIPCGPPVARVAEPPSGHYTGPRLRSYVVCRNHLPGLMRPADLRAQADSAAREALIVSNWDEYQRLLSAEVKRRMDEQLADLPEALRRLFAEDDAS